MKPEEVMCISSSEDENRIAGGNKKEYVVYVASSSDDEAALPDYNHCKYVKPLIREAMIFSGKLNQDAEFPLDAMKKTIQVARECLKKMEGDLKASTIIWDKLLHHLLQIGKSFHDNQLNNRSYRLEMVYLMADYLAFRCQIICKETQFYKLFKVEVHKEQQKLCETMSKLLENRIDSLVMTLIRIKTTKAYAVVLYRIYETVLSDKMLLEKVHERQEFVALLLCYKKWKCLVNYKDEKLKINDIAESILPKILPPVQGFHKAFHKILPDIPAHKASKSMRFLLVNQMMNVDETCNNFFKVYEKMVECEFKDKIKNFSWNTNEKPDINQLKIQLPPLSINWWVPMAGSAIQLSDSDTDAPKIAKILNKPLTPQSAPLRKPRIRKRRRVRKNNDHGCVTDDSVNDVPETARGWIVRKKIKKNKKRNTVYGEVSSTTNVDIEDKSVNNKTIYDLEREGPEIKASILVPTPITSEQIIETFSLDHPKITNIKMSAGKATRSKQDYKDVESDVIEDLRNAKETSAPKSDKINSTLKGSNNLEATGKLFVNEYLTEIKLNLSGIISESESKSIESDGTSKCKVNTNHELIWQAPGTSISPTLFPYLNPEEPSLSDDVFWSKFDNDYFRLDKPDMGTEKIYSSGIPEMTLDDAGIFSQLLDPSEFPELSKHVNMSEICENREWRKSSNRELFGSEEKNGFSTNNPPTFDSSFYY